MATVAASISDGFLHAGETGIGVYSTPLSMCQTVKLRMLVPALSCLVATGVAGADPTPDPKNLVLMVADGAGFKTYDGSINIDGSGRPADDTVAGMAHERGKFVGVVSSVLFAHATPAAAAGAHQPQRSAYCETAVEMLTNPYPDVIASCGHPEFDNNGEPVEDPQGEDFQYVGGKEIWDALTGTGKLESGQEVCVRQVEDAVRSLTLTRDQIAALARWSLRQSKSEIEALRQGPTSENSNALVPLYARGVAAERFDSLAASEDPFYGRYVDQTDVFRVLKSALEP